MESQSKAPGMHAAGPYDRRAHESSEPRMAEAAQEELLLAGTRRTNLLLMGRDDAVRHAMDTLASRLHPPVATWFPGEKLVLPPADRAGTIVLHDVGALGIQDQIQLLEWLSGAMGRMQVVSTTPATLLPRVQAGSFIDTLYYRLNTVCVEVSA